MESAPAARLVLAALICFALGGAVRLRATTSVLLTIDVESQKDGGTPARDIFGRLPGYEGEHGVPLILETLAAKGAYATFYLNVYEAARHGVAPLVEVARLIRARGQDVQLHTHPFPMFGKARMSEYDLPTQTAIVERGAQLLRDWTGAPVIAHRAGSLMADGNTLRAVAAAGLRVDASLSRGSGVPLPDVPGAPGANDATEIEGVLELPVTAFSQVTLGPWHSLRLLDLESSTLGEIERVIAQMAARRACAVNVLMHSFSITRYGVPDPSITRRLEQFLDFVRHRPDLALVTTTQFAERYRAGRLDCTPAPDFVPATGVASTYARAWERLFYGWKNAVVALSVPGAALVLVSLVFLRRRNRGARA